MCDRSDGDEPRPDPPDLFRALVIALPIGLLLWAALAAAWRLWRLWRG